MRQNANRSRRQAREAAEFDKLKARDEVWNKEARFYDWVYREVLIWWGTFTIIILSMFLLLFRTVGAILRLVRLVWFIPPLAYAHSKVGCLMANRVATWAVQVRRRVLYKGRPPSVEGEGHSRDPRTQVGRDA